MSDPRRLIDAYLDGEMTAEMEADLEAWLRAGPENVRTFVRQTHVHGQLREIMRARAYLRPEPIESAESAAQKPRELAPQAEEASRPPSPQGASERQRRSRAASVRFSSRRAGPSFGAYLAAAAAVLVGAGVLFVVTSRTAKPRPGAGVASESPSQSESPPVATAAPESPASRQGSARPPREEGGGGDLGPAAPTRMAAAPREPLRSPPIPPLPEQPRLGGPVASARSVPTPDAPAAQGAPAARAAGPTREAVARLAAVSGLVMYARGPEGTWRRAIAGIQLLDGDRIDTRTGMVRLDLDGAVIYANRGTVFPMRTTGAGRTALVELSRGEVFVENGGREVLVETPDGLISPMGTRFDVKRLPAGTTVTVEEGAVEVRAKRQPNEADAPAAEARPQAAPADGARLWIGKAVRVEAGLQTRVRRGTPPTAPVKVDVSRALTWVRLMPGPVLDTAGIHLLSGKRVQIGTARVGELVNLDRGYHFLRVPAELEGAALIRLFNDDSGERGPRFLSFRLRRRATVYVAYTNEIRTRPQWLLSAFQETKLDILTESGVKAGKSFRVYARTFDAGVVTLGGPEAGSKSVYLVLVKPQ